jgi:predicted PurR-regulated permease PerM
MDGEVFRKFGSLPVAKILRKGNIDLENLFQEAVSTINRFGAWAIDKTSRSVAQLVFNVFILFFTLFYFFMDGERLIAKLRFLSPLRNEYEEMIIDRFLLVSRAVIRGTVLVAFVQALLGAIALLAFGISTWIMWGFVMFLLALIPLCGTWLVLIPAAIIQIAVGRTIQGLGLLAVSVIVISNIDNLIRPRLVGSAAKMHDLVIFFSILGGLSTFGPLGFIVGPVLAAFFITLVEMYGIEFRMQLFSESTYLK